MSIIPAGSEMSTIQNAIKKKYLTFCDPDQSELSDSFVFLFLFLCTSVQFCSLIPYLEHLNF